MTFSPKENKNSSKIGGEKFFFFFFFEETLFKF